MENIQSPNLVELPKGASEVKIKMEEQKEAVTPVTAVTKNRKQNSTQENKSKEKNKNSGYRPVTEVTYFTNSKGLYAHSSDKEIWLASPLKVLALVHGEDGRNWGVLIEYVDRVSKKHTCILFFALMASPVEFRKFLAGLSIRSSQDRDAQSYLFQYLNRQDENLPVITLVDTCGWHGEFTSFVMPGKSIGDQKYRLDNDLAESTSQGTLEDWQKAISKLCSENSRLILAVSVAFAGPLVGFLKRDSFGIHLVGGSSEGKTTAGVFVVGSIWGEPDEFKVTWRATVNGLEAKAAERNHMILILDELKQIDPQDAIKAVYTLGNGVGKSRARKDGKAQRSLQWAVPIFSTGELFLADHLASVGQRYHAGLDMRLIQLRADAGKELGIFDTLHGRPDGAALANELNQLTKRFYGIAGPAFIKKLIERKDSLAAKIARLEKDFFESIGYEQLGRQEKRVAGHFALVAAAGELVTEDGITTWKKNEALEAVKRCFVEWLASRPKGELEDSQILNTVRQYIQEHGNSAFVSCRESSVSDDEVKALTDTARPQVQAGFKKEKGLETLWLVYPQTFWSRICPGSDHKRVVKVLSEKGWLLKGSDQTARLERIPGEQKAIRMFVLTSKVLTDEL